MFDPFSPSAILYLFYVFQVLVVGPCCSRMVACVVVIQPFFGISNVERRLESSLSAYHQQPKDPRRRLFRVSSVCSRSSTTAKYTLLSRRHHYSFCVFFFAREMFADFVSSFTRYFSLTCIELCMMERIVPGTIASGVRRNTRVLLA